MKFRIILILIAVIVINSIAFSDPITPPYEENFDTYITPDDWTNNGDEEWIFSTDASYGAASAGDHTFAGGSYYAWIDGSGGIGPNELLSPFFEIPNVPCPAVEFYYFSNNINIPNDNNTLKVDFWDGAAWNNLLTFTGDDPDWQWFSSTLCDYDITGNVQIRFSVIEDANMPYYNDILIDDFRVHDLPCAFSPTDLLVENITAISAELSWTAGCNEYLWDIEIGETGFIQTGIPTHYDATNPFLIDSLIPETNYDWYVRAKWDYTYSNWEGPCSFTTIPQTITAPLNVTINVTEANTAIYWDAVNGATSYKVFSSENPYFGFEEDDSGTLDGESWSTVTSGSKKFYYVQAINDSE